MKTSKGYALYSRLLSEQRKWIEKCEQGSSYLGPDGRSIREADQEELRRIQFRLRELTPDTSIRKKFGRIPSAKDAQR